MKVVVILYQLTTSTDHALKSAEIRKILKEIDAVTKQSIAEVRVIYVITPAADSRGYPFQIISRKEDETSELRSFMVGKKLTLWKHIVELGELIDAFRSDDGGRFRNDCILVFELPQSDSDPESGDSLGSSATEDTEDLPVNDAHQAQAATYEVNIINNGNGNNTVVNNSNSFNSTGYGECSNCELKL